MNSRPSIRLAERFRHLRGMRILLVEDNELNQQVASELMKNVGIEITIASDGLKAIQIAQSGAFDAILMDVQMPEMDGYTATREIRSAEAQKRRSAQEQNDGQSSLFNFQSSIPIIAMTANTSAEDRRLALESGMNDFLTKPIVSHQLFTTLSKWFRRRVYENSPHHQDREELSLEFQVSDVQTKAQLPAHLLGIDVAAGVVRMGGNLSRYITVLQQFVSRYAAAPDEIADLLALRHIVQARQLVHTLKGVAGNLGADMLHKDLEAFEAALREERCELWDAHLRQIRGAFRQVIDAVATLPSPDRAVPSADLAPSLSQKIVDTATILPRLSQLRHFLAENDTESLQCVAALVDICAETELAPQFAQLKTMIGQYDFDRALDAVERIVRQLKSVS